MKSIVAAARRNVLSEGLAQAKMAVIAADAKVSTATVYAYFPSKNDLFRAVVEDVAADVERRLAAPLMDLEGEPIESLAKAILARLADEGVHSLFRIMAVEGDRFPETRRIFDTYTRLKAHKAAISLFGTMAARDEFPAGDAELASRQLLGMLEHETIVLDILEGRERSRRGDDEIARNVSRTLRARFAMTSSPGR